MEKGASLNWTFANPTPVNTGAGVDLILTHTLANVRQDFLAKTVRPTMMIANTNLALIMELASTTSMISSASVMLLTQERNAKKKWTLVLQIGALMELLVLHLPTIGTISALVLWDLPAGIAMTILTSA